MKTFLLDAGPLIAFLDAADSRHEWVGLRWRKMYGRVITTGAVITEVMFFMEGVRDGPARLVEFLEAGRVEIFDCFTPARLFQAEKLMTRYLKVPMDFADATLIGAAEYYDTAEIVTLDVRGFRSFRYHGDKRFRLVLQDL